MRHILFILTLLCLLQLPVTGYAQDDTTQSSAKASSEKEKTLYSNATDSQIQEAQQFYTKCSGNETVSAKRDCKCAATKYLQTRIELGDTASANEIMNKTVNLCLKDGAREINASNSASVSEATDKQIEEADEVYHECKKDMRMKVKFDCECFAATFLNERIKVGPIRPKSLIYSDISGTCQNIVDMTGQRYSECMEGPLLISLGNIERKDFCECYARTWAKNIEAVPTDMLYAYKESVATNSLFACQNPNAYK